MEDQRHYFNGTDTDSLSLSESKVGRNRYYITMNVEGDKGSASIIVTATLADVRALTFMFNAIAENAERMAETANNA